MMMTHSASRRKHRRPQLMEIAAGEHESLRDQFVRIKASSARTHARPEAAELLRKLARTAKASPIRTCWPAAAAEDALA